MPQLQIQVPSRFVTKDMIADSAGIEASKIVHQRSITQELFGPAASVTALTKWIHQMRGASGTIRGFEAAIAVVASDVSRTVTVDLQKSTGAGAFATVCSATIGFTNASSVRTLVAAVLSNASLVDGDILEVIVTVAGGSGTQATGLTVTLVLDEDYS
jgi:hypothetical protein